MTKVSVEEAANRLEEAGINFADRYAKGVEGAGGKWHSAASKAGKNYEVGVTQAMQRDAFQKGIQEAGASAYDEGVRTKGVTNWPTGMQVAGAKYARKIQKFATLWDAPLATPKGARRSPQNIKRMQENAERFIRVAGK